MNDSCNVCSDDLKCPECKCGCDLSQTTDLENGDVVECMGCGEEYWYWVGRLVSQDEYHEYSCDSAAARRYEDSAYGDDDEIVSYRGGRFRDREDGYEDFHSDG